MVLVNLVFPLGLGRNWRTQHDNDMRETRRSPLGMPIIHVTPGGPADQYSVYSSTPKHLNVAVVESTLVLVLMIYKRSDLSPSSPLPSSLSQGEETIGHVRNPTHQRRRKMKNKRLTSSPLG